jgi:hypothetical protein
MSSTPTRERRSYSPCAIQNYCFDIPGRDIEAEGPPHYPPYVGGCSKMLSWYMGGVDFGLCIVNPSFVAFHTCDLEFCYDIPIW